MKDFHDVCDKVEQYEGVLVSDTAGVIHDGKEYDYAARFDDDEHIDIFLENVSCEEGVARDIVDGYLTLFFSLHK